MGSQTKAMIGIVLALLVLAGAGLGFYSWLQAHDARLLMQQTIKDKDAQIAARDKENADLREKIAKQPIQQVIKYVPRVVNIPDGTPEPVPIAIPNQMTPQDVSKLPDAPSTLLPDVTFRLLLSQAADDITCQKDLKDTQEKFKAAQTASRGGGFWRRLRSNAHFAIIGGVVTAGIVCGTGHCK